MPMNCVVYSLPKFLMPPNNNNLTSALSRQMQHLRRQVDRIDLKMLQLLQQRTKLSGRIGRMKHRHGAVIYVPERERELVARLIRLSKGRLSARAVAALYREILSSSRAAQGQAPIGLLRAERFHGDSGDPRLFRRLRSIFTSKNVGGIGKGPRHGRALAGFADRRTIWRPRFRRNGGGASSSSA